MQKTFSKGEKKHFPTLQLSLVTWDWNQLFLYMKKAHSNCRAVFLLSCSKPAHPFPSKGSSASSHQLESCPRRSHPGKNITGCTLNRSHTSIFYWTWAVMPFFEAELVMAICFSNFLWYHKLPMTASFKAWLMARLRAQGRPWQRKDTASWVASLGHINILHLIYQEYIYAVTRVLEHKPQFKSLFSRVIIFILIHERVIQDCLGFCKCWAVERKGLWAWRNLVVLTPQIHLCQPPTATLLSDDRNKTD